MRSNKIESFFCFFGQCVISLTGKRIKEHISFPLKAANSGNGLCKFGLGAQEQVTDQGSAKLFDCII